MKLFLNPGFYAGDVLTLRMLFRPVSLKVFDLLGDFPSVVPWFDSSIAEVNSQSSLAIRARMVSPSCEVIPCVEPLSLSGYL